MSYTPGNGMSKLVPDEKKVTSVYFSGGEKKFSDVKKEVVDGKKVLSAREKLGEELLRLHEADMLTVVKSSPYVTDYVQGGEAAAGRGKTFPFGWEGEKSSTKPAQSSSLYTRHVYATP